MGGCQLKSFVLLPKPSLFKIIYGDRVVTILKKYNTGKVWKYEQNVYVDAYPVRAAADSGPKLISQ